MGFWSGTHNDSVTRGDVKLYINRSVAARRERERARDAKSARKARQYKADRQRQIDKMRRGESTKKSSWW